MDEDRLIHRFPRGEDEEVRLSLRKYKGRQYLDLRLWFLHGETGEYLPTKKGLIVGVEHLNDLKCAVERADEIKGEFALQGVPNS